MQVSSTGSGPADRYHATAVRASYAAAAVPAPASPMLLPGREVGAAILLPAGFVGFGALRTLLAVADRLQPVGGNSELHQEILGGTGAAVAQAEIVFGRAALVAVAFHHDRRVREIGEDALDGGRIPGQHVARIAADIALVVIEVDVLDVGAEALLEGDAVGLSRLGRRRRRRRRVTVTVADAVMLPPGPVAVRV